MYASACAPLRDGPLRVDRAAPAALQLQVDDTLRILDPVTAAPRASFAGAIAAPDRTRLFTAIRGDGGAQLEVRSGETGDLLSRHSIPPALIASVASASGRKVALAPEPIPGGNWLAEARDRTRLVVADLERDAQREFDLPGNYAPEAFSQGEDRLFLVEYLPPRAPNRYRVRQLDLASGRVSPVGARDPKSLSVEEEMRGRHRTQVLAPDHSRLYTLYLRDDEHLHRRDYLEAGGPGVRPHPELKAFVHVLSLTEGWAYCLDLPLPFGVGPAESHALALSPDGKRLYVADASAGASILEADTEKLQVRTVRPKLEPMGNGAGTPAVLRIAPDGRLHLAAGRDWLIFDRTLHPVHHHQFAESMRGVELTADGTRLLAAGSAQMTIYDIASGAAQGTFTFPEGESPRVAAHH
jgi:hypothetical protein